MKNKKADSGTSTLRKIYLTLFFRNNLLMNKYSSKAAPYLPATWMMEYIVNT